MSNWEKMAESFLFYAFMGEVVFMRIAATLVAIWVIVNSAKTAFFKKHLFFALVLLVSSLILILYPNYLALFIPSLTELFIVFALIGIEIHSITQKQNKSISTSIKENPKGALGGLLIYLGILIFAVYIYNKNYHAFGDYYTHLETYGYCNKPSRTLHAVWAWGFLGVYPEFYRDASTSYYHGYYYLPSIILSLIVLLQGIFAPIIFALNGFILQHGRRVFSFLISTCVIAMYVLLPFIIGTIMCFD